MVNRNTAELLSLDVFISIIASSKEALERAGSGFKKMPWIVSKGHFLVDSLPFDCQGSAGNLVST